MACVVPQKTHAHLKVHLAAVLLEVTSIDPAIRALANIRSSPAIDRILSGGSHGRVDRGGGQGSCVFGVPMVLEPGDRALHDPGAFGIEPGWYVLEESVERLPERLASLSLAEAP